MISLLDIQRGYEFWASKPHNAKWVRRIDGTPIPNDIPVSVFNYLRDNGLLDAALQPDRAGSGDAVRLAAERIAESFKEEVSASAGVSFEKTGVILPGMHVFERYARAALTQPSEAGRVENLARRLADSLEVFTQHYESWMEYHGDDENSNLFFRHTFGDLRHAIKLINEANSVLIVDAAIQSAPAWSGDAVRVDQSVIDRVATALEGVDIGHSMTLVRLVDGVHTYTLKIQGEIETFVDNDDSDAVDQVYARIREVKHRIQAEAVVAALTSDADRPDTGEGQVDGLR